MLVFFFGMQFQTASTNVCRRVLAEERKICLDNRGPVVTVGHAADMHKSNEAGRNGLLIEAGRTGLQIEAGRTGLSIEAGRTGLSIGSLKICAPYPYPDPAPAPAPRVEPEPDPDLLDLHRRTQERARR